MKLDINKYQDVSINELVEVGKESRERLIQYLEDVQSAIGENSELHPDFMDALFDALEVLDWDPDKFIEEWVGRG